MHRPGDPRAGPRDATPPAALLFPYGIGVLLRTGNQRPDRTHSGRAMARLLPPQRRRRAGYAYATTAIAKWRAARVFAPAAAGCPVWGPAFGDRCRSYVKRLMVFAVI
jgi:hypothetical protein